MRIEEIDKNMINVTSVTEPDIVWLDANDAPFSLHGLQFSEEENRYRRLPKEVAEAVSRGVADLAKNTAGGRIRFRTNSSFIAIHAVMKNKTLMDHITLVGQSGFDLYRKNESGFDIYYKSFRPPMGMKEGYTSPQHTDGKMAEYTINFPLYDYVEKLYIALKKDAVLEAATPYETEKPIVYYGSSITQGGCASRPGNTYQAILSRRLKTDHVNLGFSGSGRAEPVMREYLADLCQNASAFVCDYDHNAPNADYLQQTHYPLYEAVRKKNPNLPILFVSAPDILLNPVNYIPRREIIRGTYERARAQGDEKVWFLPGDKLFEGECWDSCTVDGCHPNDLGFYRMAMAMEPYLKEMLKKQ